MTYKPTEEGIERALNVWFYPDPPGKLKDHFDEHVNTMKAALIAAAKVRESSVYSNSHKGASAQSNSRYGETK